MSLFQQQHCTSDTTTRSQPWPIRLEFEVGRGGDATQILKLSCTYIVYSYMYNSSQDITQSCKMQACQTFQRFITMQHGVHCYIYYMQCK